MAIKLHREAARALLKEARSDFENGAAELYSVGDESQRPVIEACVEVIGKLEKAERFGWSGEPDPHFEQVFVEFDFSPAVWTWIERNRLHMALHVEELDQGETVGAEPGYVADQVYLLHVLDRLLADREAVAA